MLTFLQLPFSFNAFAWDISATEANQHKMCCPSQVRLVWLHICASVYIFFYFLIILLEMAQDCVYQSNFLSMPGQEKPAALMQIQNIPTVAASQLQYSTTSSSRCEFMYTLNYTLIWIFITSHHSHWGSCCNWTRSGAAWPKRRATVKKKKKAMIVEPNTRCCHRRELFVDIWYSVFWKQMK